MTKGELQKEAYLGLMVPEEDFIMAREAQQQVAGAGS